jgi:molecular chaperone DnaJ
LAGGPIAAPGLTARSLGPPLGDDLCFDLVLSLGQVLTGGKQVVSISRPGPRPDCDGSGARTGTTPRSCPDCGWPGGECQFGARLPAR